VGSRAGQRPPELLLADPATAPHGGRMLVIDDSGDRKDGVNTAHLGHQCLGRMARTTTGGHSDHGVGRSCEALRLGKERAGIPYQARRCWHAIRDGPQAGRRAQLAYGQDAHTPVVAARALAWGGPDDHRDWHPVTCTFREGCPDAWWATDAALGWWGSDGRPLAWPRSHGSTASALAELRPDEVGKIESNLMILGCAVHVASPAERVRSQMAAW